MSAVITDPKLRKKSLDNANLVRTEMKEQVERVASGEESIANAVLKCHLPIRVDRLLGAQRGWGPVKVQQALRIANIPTGPVFMGNGGSRLSRRILSDAERRRLILTLAGTPAVRDSRPKLLDRVQEGEIRRRMERVGCTVRQITEVLAA